MAIKQTNREYCPFQNGYVCEYVVDTVAEIASLPSCCTKSTALVVSTGEVYMVNASGRWAKFGG